MWQPVLWRIIITFSCYLTGESSEKGSEVSYCSTVTTVKLVTTVTVVEHAVTVTVVHVTTVKAVRTVTLLLSYYSTLLQFFTFFFILI